MELLAAIRALQALESLPDTGQSLRVQLHTDSQYVQKGISEWSSFVEKTRMADSG